MAWQDIPVPGSRVRGEAGSGDPTTVTGRTSTRRRDELLLKLDRTDGEGDEGGSLVELAAVRAASHRHPAFAEVGRAMGRLRKVNPSAWRVLNRRLVGVCSGNIAEVHALAEARLEEFPLRTALIGLCRLLPEQMGFPREVVAGLAAWEEWLAACRPQSGRKQGQTVASSISPGAQGQRFAFARALADAGVSQKLIAERLGVSQQAVSYMLRGHGMRDVTEAFTSTDTAPSSRELNRDRLEAEALRSQPSHSGGVRVPELRRRFTVADDVRQRVVSGLAEDECVARASAWEQVRKVRGW